MRMAHFRKSWTGAIKSYIQTMEAHCREVWTTEFLPLKPKQAPKKDSNEIFLRNLMGLPIDTETDEFTKYDRDPTQIDDPKDFQSNQVVERRSIRLPYAIPLGFGHISDTCNVS